MLEIDRQKEINNLSENLELVIAKKEAYNALPVKEKVYERIRMTRRKVLTKGFLASALVMAGAFRISRSAADLLLEEGDRTLDIPDYLKQTPDHMARIPHYIKVSAEKSAETAINVAENTPPTIAKAPRLIPYTIDEIKNTRIIIADECTPNGTNEDGHVEGFHIGADLPFISSETHDEVCIKNGHGPRVGYVAPTKNRGQQEAEDIQPQQPHEDNPVKRDLIAIGVGLAIAGAGLKIASQPGVKHTITRRNFLEKMERGLLLGVLTNTKVSEKIGDLTEKITDQI